MIKLLVVISFLFLAGCASVQDRSEITTRNNIERLVVDVANREGVPAHIALGLVSVESRFNPRALGAAGEIGLVQIKYQSARGIGYTGTRAQLFNPETNLVWGMRYLRHATRNRWDCAGVSSYQRGRASAHVCTSYGRMLLARAEQFRR